MVDQKYMRAKLTSLLLTPPLISRFWKGVKSIIQTLKFGYRWKVGVGDKIRFWEDTWFGTSPLAVQFWHIYMICNEQTKSVKEIWDGETLKLTFRRNFDNKMMEQWYQLVEIAKEINFSNDPDALIWQLESKGIYSSSSLYHVINFRGVQPLFLPAVWKLAMPPKIHVFLWLFSQNKFMTRDNLRKRHIIKPLECVFCAKHETNHHLFFDCVVAKNIWSFISQFFQKDLGTNF